ncbi:hypothetical protein HPB50_024373 [Hyalomma asiaticum]|uniref:Uncharacterized protein n=1 Tax=Hyalomma asiaticum TaxID=266040 RepID=A0ACB7TQ15_HYAAI|nr:hypothetical protein HPB50_024373 [Hyalomma asiaticum]
MRVSLYDSDSERHLKAHPLTCGDHRTSLRRPVGTPCDLVTGEERRCVLPDGQPAPHVACTVEMAAVHTPYDVAVIDEIQMMRDPQRGWAWTRALLGLAAKELHLCGEAAAVGLVRNLLASLGEELEKQGQVTWIWNGCHNWCKSFEKKSCGSNCQMSLMTEMKVIWRNSSKRTSGYDLWIYFFYPSASLTSSMDPAIHQAVNDSEVEVGLHGSDPPSNVVPFQSHHHVVGQIGCHESSYSFLYHSSDQASGPFLFDPYGHILADCSSALQSSRSVHHANNLWLLALNAPEDLVRQSHRNHPCDYRLSVRLWEGDDFTECEELCQEVIKLTSKGAAESDVTFLEYAQCEQDVPLTGEMTDAEIVQMATNGGDGGDDGNDESP